jgi:FMN phosphatase YigB (HAD superfamily)
VLRKFAMAAATKPAVIPRVLVLDCGGITNPDCGGANEAVAAAMGVSPADARRGHKAAWALSRSDPQRADYWMHAMEIAGVSLELRTPERAAACEAALAPTLRTAFTDTIAVINAQREAHKVTVGMISNHIVSPPLFDYCAEGAGLRDLVSHHSLLVVSQAVGLAKPDPAIYQFFFERLRCLDERVEPSEILFIDDKEANVEAARSQGWQGLVFNAVDAQAGDLTRLLGELGLALG